MSLIGVDFGGTRIKAIAFSLNGDIIASESREYSTVNERPGCFELDPYQVWQYAKEIIAIVAHACKDEIHAITVSSLGESFVCFDKEDHILTKFITYHDQRGKELFKELVDYFTLDTMKRVVGPRVNFIQSLYRLLVLKKEKPDIIDKTDKISFAADFILHMLGAEEHYCDYTVAMTTSCFNMEKLKWQEEYIEWAGIDPEIFPKVVPAGTQIGTLSPTIALEMGIRPGARLVIGPYDQVASTIGANTYQPGQLFNSIGTADAMLTFADKLADAKKAGDAGLFYDMHYYPNIYTVHLSPQYAGGSVLQWFRDHFGRYEKHISEEEGKDFYCEYEKKIPLEPTDLMVMGYFAGLLDGGNAKGTILNLTLDTKNETIYRAFMEGETYLARSRINELTNIGFPVQIVKTVGGGSKSNKFMQLRADIFKIPVATVSSTEPGVFGNALLGGAAAGVYDDIADIAEKLVHITKIYEPDPVRMKIYDEKFDQHQMLLKLLYKH